jgi:hypothetical protein
MVVEDRVAFGNVLKHLEAAALMAPRYLPERYEVPGDADAGLEPPHFCSRVLH